MVAPKVDRTVRMEKLCRKYRIVLLREQGYLKWPEELRNYAKIVKSISQVQYDTYATDKGSIQDDPWKIEAKERGMALTELAHRCRGRREATWRSHCERVVFSRFNSEVTCKTCHKRLWRSDIESSRSGEGARARALRRRQELRIPCRCLHLTSSVPKYLRLEQPGLSKIFGHREQEPMIQNPGLMKELPMGKEPDAVYGLRQTANFDNLLNGRAKVQDVNSPVEHLLRDTIIASPMVEDGELLLFPFLIYEAKKESGSDWHSVCLQGAFPIREALMSQKSVKDKTGVTSQWQSGPFCWYVANRGSDWRVFACFTREGQEKRGTEGTTEYCIAPFWGGSILSLDGSLQLLLVADYIFDWARDIYRDDLLRELRLLSSDQPYTASVLVSDSDILSTRGVSPPLDAAEAGLKGQDQGCDPAQQHLYESLDQRFGCVRDGLTFTRRYSFLCLSHVNIGSFVQSLQSNEIRLISRLIISLAAETEPFWFNYKQLRSLQMPWTGTPADDYHDVSPDLVFRTYLASYAYLAPEWRIVSELCVISMDQSAFQRIEEIASFNSEQQISSSFANAPESLPNVRKLLLHLLREEIRSPPDTLMMAIHRQARKYRKSGSNITFSKTYGLHKGLFDFVHQLPQDKQELVKTCVYRSQRKFRFPRLSQENSCQPSCPRGYVLVHGTISQKDLSTKSTICLFMFREDAKCPDSATLREAISHCIACHDVYHTTLNDEMYGPQDLEANSVSVPWIWNLENTLGMFTIDSQLRDWLKSLGCKMPPTQGALRDTQMKKAGRTLLLRDLNPWRDPRCKYPDISTHVFLVYKLFRQEKIYWETVAQEKMSQGIRCCSACATEDDIDPIEDDIDPVKEITVKGENSDVKIKGEEIVFQTTLCQFCQSRLSQTDLPQWLRRVYEKSPIAVEPINDYELRNRLLGVSSVPQTIYHDDLDDWEKNLNFYPRLNEDFRDLDELYLQLEDFQAYRKRRLSGGYQSLAAISLGKRKREADSRYDEPDSWSWRFCAESTIALPQEACVMPFILQLNGS